MTHRERITWSIYYLIKILIVIGMAVAIWNREWLHAFLIGIVFLATFLPTIIKTKYRLYMPVAFDLLIIAVIYFSFFLGSINNYYYKFWWWDLFLHTSAGIWVGGLGFLLTYIINAQKNINIHMKPGFVAFFAFTFSMAMGGIWEILEFIMDNIFGQNMQHMSETGLIDTMWDIIVNFFGALVISITGYLWLKYDKPYFVFDKSIVKFIKRNKHLFKNNG